MNKDLYGKYFELGENQTKHLMNYRGNEIIDNILSSGKVSYSKLKKIKHEMENGRKEELGGDSFYNWVNDTLSSNRNAIDLSKKIKKDSGVNNAFLSPHTKNNKLNNLNRPSKSHHSNNDEIKINESLKRINELIKKII